jgi:hypothetical protein
MMKQVRTVEMPELTDEQIEAARARQGLTLVQFPAQPDPFMPLTD